MRTSVLTVFCLLAVTTLSATQERVDSSMETHVPILIDDGDQHISPEVLVDKRQLVNLVADLDSNYEERGSSKVDVSTTKASDKFQALMHIIEETQRPSADAFDLHTIPDKLNGQILIHWKIRVNNNGEYTYKVILRTTDVNNKENPVHKDVYKYHCKHYAYVDQFLCVSAKCEVTPFSPTPPPAIRCAMNYRFSQQVITTVYESTHESTTSNPNEDVYVQILQCMKEKVERLPPRGEEICFYIGFEPENIVSIEEMHSKLIEDGWKKTQDNTYERRTVVEERKAVGIIDQNEMTLVDGNIAP